MNVQRSNIAHTIAGAAISRLYNRHILAVTIHEQQYSVGFRAAAEPPTGRLIVDPYRDVCIN